MARLFSRFMLLVACLVLTGATFSDAQAPSRPASPAPARGILTNQWVVLLSPGANANEIAQQTRSELLGPVGYLPDVYVMRRPGSERGGVYALNAARAFANSGKVVYFQQQIMRRYQPMVPGDEPLFPDQWHLNNTGQFGGIAGEDSNVPAAWNAGYTGAGVQVAVVDEGIEYTHPDLAPNFTFNGSWDYTPDDDNDPFPTDPTPNDPENHGTSVGGVIAAADEGTCGAGVAYEAALTSLRTDWNMTDAIIADMLSHERNLNDIYNNSWGMPTQTSTIDGEFQASTAVLVDNVTNGRGGLGNIYTFAAGNAGADPDSNYPGGGENANRSRLNSWRYTISVAASTNEGVRAGYSEFGTPVLVNAPSDGGTAAIFTTDRTGSSGYNGLADLDCTNDFGGTSSATPLVSGIIALMLNANPNLTWRDVQHVLAESAEKNDPADPSWFTNAAGYDLSIYYGFGRAVAGAATTLAADWQMVPAEFSVSSGTQTVNQAIPNTPDTLTTSVNITEEMVLEHVEVHVSIDHAWPGDVIMNLTSPSGTVSQIMTQRDYSGGSYADLTMMSVHHWGESPVGTWTLELSDGYPPLDDGTLVDWELILYGMPVLSNDDQDTPELVSSMPFTDTANVFQTTPDNNAPIPTCGGDYRSVWYQITPEETGTYTFYTRGSDYDTVLSIREGSTEIVCNNDAGGQTTSIASAQLDGGTSYTIMVSSDDGAYGNLVFNTVQHPTPLSPENGSTLTTAPVLPTFGWIGLKNATNYRVFVRFARGTAVINTTFDAQDICQDVSCAISNGDYIAVPRWGLLNDDYEWWVGAELPGGWVWSQMQTFTVDVPPAELPVISANPGDGRVAISWPDDPNTLWVQIWMGPYPNGNYFEWHERDGSGPNFTCDGTTCTMYPAWDIVSKDAGGNPYDLTVWMQAWGPGGFSSGGTAAIGAPSWNRLSDVNGSPAKTFQLPQSAPLVPIDIQPSGAIADNPTSISWTGQPGSTWYQVILYEPESHAIPYNNWHQASEVACDGALVDPADYECEATNLSLDLMPNTDYEIYIRAWGPGGFSDYVSESFTYPQSS